VCTSRVMPSVEAWLVKVMVGWKGEAQGSGSSCFS
jgi:hypothetical protein